MKYYDRVRICLTNKYDRLKVKWEETSRMKYASLRVDQIQLYEKIRLECNEIGIRDRQEKQMNLQR